MRRKRINLLMLPGLCLLVAVASQGSCDSGGTFGGAEPPPPMWGPGCGLVTCATASAKCGPVGDGCGGTIDCGSCDAPTTCGGGGQPFQCGGTNACVPLTCAQLALGCGITTDGCGNGLSCYPNGTSACPNPGDTCGGGGVNGVCGSPPTGGPMVCVPRTCEQLGYTCGTTSDGCGGQLNCYPGGGSSCPNAGETCGGGGIQFQCGMTNACVPITSCGALNCGMIGDGCGGTLNCTTATPMCPGAQTCGGGGMANVCGPPACTPKGTGDCGSSCGYINDGCGGTVNCSTINACTPPATCGGGGMPNVCSAPACVPKTCAMLGANCGWAGDGCGNLICCGTLSGTTCSTTCPAGQLCGSLQPNQCGNNIGGGSSTMCMPGVNTTITGTVVAPTDSAAGFGTPDPIYNATVFVPSGPVQAITTGATCNQCATSQPAIVSTTTAIDGTFTLTNPPTGPNVTLVIQLGKWRRVLTLTVNPCVNNALTTGQTRLPRKQAEGSTYDNIPRFAISTGNVDVMECVLRKMGVADTEFVAGDTGTGVPTTGRVHIYKASFDANNGASGAVLGSAAGTPPDNNLWGAPATLNSYDAVLFPCTGGADAKTTAAQTNLVDYANKGGRVFSTHYSYVWLNNNTQLGSVAPMATGTWRSTATWDTGGGSYTGPNNGLIDLGFPKGVNLSQWLQNVVPPAAATLSAAMNATTNTANVASTTGYPTAGTLIIEQEQVIYTSRSGNQFRGLTRGANGTTAAAHPVNATMKLWAQIPVSVIRNDFDAVSSNAQRWMYVQNNAPGNGPGNFPIHYTFNTPVGLAANNQCGRVVFSDFHVENHSGSKNLVFPAECSGSTPMTPQEKLLEFMLFDLTSCVAPDVPTCTPKTCNNVGAKPYTCGQWGDGCGGTLNCGACPTGTCGGAGVPGECGAPMCVPTTCAMLGNVCGAYSDGCASTINCNCGAGSTCVSGRCVAACTPLTCNQLGYSCGQWSNGCGGIATCPNCPTGQTCGGGGVAGQCGGCVPLTCSQLGLMCGASGDGCGGTLNCGTCTGTDTCGGGGTAGVCGTPGSGPACRPITCAQQGVMCGQTGDGCGNLINCGSCPAGQSCGGAGMAGQCGSTGCTPFTCETVPHGPANCGVIGDGCGGTVDCGTCESPQICGGSGAANRCGIIG